ncbi:Protein CBG03487 [Caenorhabditis briggsae]|uniref:Protein CBG03487 n=1 Tax=Caenorhabditis briggsae TaxID=6238 RepID=A8WV68_CAEBR|nr:Protein CBG03487 [Caenorhabditis briggsae]CAP24379.2 Protein CBG03487 [Caenorhabditis briggsae]
MIRQESSDYLRQKQAQWEKEKGFLFKNLSLFLAKFPFSAESESRPEWFPFGENLTPGGGSPLRKFVPKEPVESSTRKISEEASTSMHSIETTTSPDRKQSDDVNSCQHNQHYHAPPSLPQHHPNSHHPYSYPMYSFQYPIAPFHHQMTASVSSCGEQHTNQHPQVFAPHYQVIPAGAIPVSTIVRDPSKSTPYSKVQSIDPSQICPVDQMGMWTLPPPTGPNGMRYGIPIPAPLVPQITASIMESSKMTSSMNNTILNAMTSSTSSNDSSSESGVSGVKESKEDKKKKKDNVEADEKIHREERQSTSDYTGNNRNSVLIFFLIFEDDDPIPLTRRSTTGSITYNYADQIAERRKFEQEQEDRERQELLEVERQRRILEDRRNSEEETRKRADRERIEEEQRRADQFAAAMEKAKKEAELLKRAKLYKHVLRGAEEEGGTEQLSELEQKLLGVDIETGRRLLKEVSEVEWHKKQDEVEMKKNAPQPEKQSHNISTMSIGNQSSRGRSSSISSPSKQDSSFTRNSLGRRSVRTTSREKQGYSVEKDQNQTARSDPLLPPQQSPAAPVSLESRPLALPRQNECHVAVSSPVQGALPGNRELPSPSEMMLNSGSYYCPMNRDPLSHREESRAIQKYVFVVNFVFQYNPFRIHTQEISNFQPTNSSGAYYNNNHSKFDGVGRRSNETTQSALFGPIATRSSIRRGNMRGTGLPSPPSVRMTQTHKSQIRTSSFEESSSGGEDGGSISPDLNHKNFGSPLPSSTENVHPAPCSPPNKSTETFEFKTPSRARSALSSPMNNFLNGGDNDSPTSRPASRLMQRLEQKGTIRRDDEIISQEIRRVAETNLSRSPSLASLRGSIQNLSIRGSHLNLAEIRTSDGVEFHNAVNVVGQVMLYELLQNEIKRAIFLSSATVRMACYSRDLNFLSVYAGPYQAYASSKLNLAVYVNEVSRKRHVTAVSLHPGTVPGHLYHNANPLVRYLNATILPKILRKPEMAAILVLHTVLREDIQPGAYYEDTEVVNLADCIPEQVSVMLTYI